MLTFFKNLFTKKRIDYPDLIERGAIIVDVRTPNEFSKGHVKNAVNIPLSNIQNHIKELKQKNKPIIACCRSGARSARATKILNNSKIETYNGGSWNQVDSTLANL